MSSFSTRKEVAKVWLEENRPGLDRFVPELDSNLLDQIINAVINSEVKDLVADIVQDLMEGGLENPIVPPDTDEAEVIESDRIELGQAIGEALREYYDSLRGGA